MSVYNPTGSGSVHMDKAISGGKKVAAKKPPFPPKKGTDKEMPPGKKAAPGKKVPAKKAGY